MQNARFALALSRLEAALARVEAAAAVAVPNAEAAHYAALAERHRKLREGASEALARLDRLIGGAN